MYLSWLMSLEDIVNVVSLKISSSTTQMQHQLIDYLEVD